MASSNVVLAVIGVFILCISLVRAEGDCIKGMYHKPSPGPEQGFPICQEYSSNTCCTKSFTVKLKASRTEELYNHTWDLCKELSKPCEKYWFQQVCSVVFFNFVCFIVFFQIYLYFFRAVRCNHVYHALFLGTFLIITSWVHTFLQLFE